MSLRTLANSAIRLVNGNQQITWQQSTGYTTNAAGKRTPAFSASTISAQIQALSGSDMKHMDGMSVQGVMRTVYMYGNPQGVVRVDAKGGDVLVFAEVPGGPGRNWLVSQVMETWPDWARVIVTLQAS